jgi:hypothetical protein
MRQLGCESPRRTKKGKCPGMPRGSVRRHVWRGTCKGIFCCTTSALVVGGERGGRGTLDRYVVSLRRRIGRSMLSVSSCQSSLPQI